MRVLSALMFFPRGGSAHVARAIARALPEHGWETTVLSGSLPGLGDARAFYSGLDVRAVDFGAVGARMHPSYEDRPDAKDVVFARVDDATYEEHVLTWERALLDADAADADVLHLHHLTPINEAAARVAPDVPVVGHLHGTELLMLERIAEGAPDWPHAAAWAERLRRWAQACERLLVLTESQIPRAVALLGVDPARVRVAPNGVDLERFRRRDLDRTAFWRRHLVDVPRGWRPGEDEGTIAYDDAAVAAMADGPVIVSVGRFTAVKRVPLLIRAFARARRRTGIPASLVLVGGHPGEWEGEHPFTAAQAVGGEGIFLAGWHDHAALPSFFSAADAVALASVREQFGNVLVEGMACGLPAVAVDRFGPAAIVDDGRTGWLVEPDDEAAMADALADVIADASERQARGRRAAAVVTERYGWSALAGRLAAVLDDVAADRPVDGEEDALTSA